MYNRAARAQADVGGKEAESLVKDQRKYVEKTMEDLAKVSSDFNDSYSKAEILSSTLAKGNRAEVLQQLGNFIKSAGNVGAQTEPDVQRQIQTNIASLQNSIESFFQSTPGQKMDATSIAPLKANLQRLMGMIKNVHSKKVQDMFDNVQSVAAQNKYNELLKENSPIYQRFMKEFEKTRGKKWYETENPQEILEAIKSGKVFYQIGPEKSKTKDSKPSAKTGSIIAFTEEEYNKLPQNKKDRLIKLEQPPSTEQKEEPQKQLTPQEQTKQNLQNLIRQQKMLRGY